MKQRTCPICGQELVPSKKDPDFLLCYNCKKKFKATDKPQVKQPEPKNYEPEIHEDPEVPEEVDVPEIPVMSESEEEKEVLTVDSKRCPQCDFENMDYANFCAICGTSLTGAAPAMNGKKGGGINKKLLAIIAAVLLVVIIAVVVLGKGLNNKNIIKLHT